MDTPVERNPQAAQMADESMLRTLRFQIEAIWPQESALFARYALPVDASILDVGCGTGEATVRLAAMFPGASLVCGVDVMPELLAVARRRPEPPTGRMPQFEQGDGFALRFPDASFDLVVCRHVTQLVPQPERLLTELRRLLKPGGWLHILSEDYGMLHFPPRNGIDPDRLWNEAVVPYTQSTGTDARIGRSTLPLLRALGLLHTSLQYLTIDTERVPREYLVGIFTAWRDGYAEPLATAGRLSHTEILGMFEAIIDAVSDPQAYGVWHVPVVAGHCP